jgi:3-oxoacyl-[acyl-carrier protein] reductase
MDADHLTSTPRIAADQQAMHEAEESVHSPNGLHHRVRDQSLAGKVAIVTGAGRGIGAAIARRLGASGANVIATYNRSNTLASRLVQSLIDEGFRAQAVKLDIASPREIEETFASVAERFGCIDILVNNAGLEMVGRIGKVSLADLNAVVSVNVTGLFIAVQEAVRYMPPGGRIINIGSISSEYMPYPGRSVYAMTKSAVSGLTRGLVRELAEKSITINNVQPGRINTDMLKSVLGDKFEQVQSQMPLSRFGEASEVAELVHFLSAPEAGYITGANIRADGGVSA